VEIRLIRTDKDHRAALAEIEKLWGASIGTPEGDKLDVLVTSKPMRSGASICDAKKSPGRQPGLSVSTTSANGVPPCASAPPQTGRMRRRIHPRYGSALPPPPAAVQTHGDTMPHRIR
jgi:hypothetical protein